MELRDPEDRARIERIERRWNRALPGLIRRENRKEGARGEART